MLALKCAHQTYAWGKRGRDSEVAKLLSEADSGFCVNENQSYAELWVGTHPKGPSILRLSGEPLSVYLAKHPSMLGDNLCKVLTTAATDAVQLPFLFKVLSVQKALSVQVHPNKTEAKKIHAEDPHNYPDANHKPEMAIALTPFELLCGFRPLVEIAQFIADIPELFDLIGMESLDRLHTVVQNGVAANGPEAKVVLKQCFSLLMKQSDASIAKSLASLIERIAVRMSQGADTSDVLGDLILRLQSEFPGDVGCFAPYFLNHFVLQPGEAVFLGPNEPHAYLFGDCIECMACSDNTVRAGLTPKFKDLDRLCQMLTYRTGTANDNKFTPIPHTTDSHILVYKPPVPEFIVERIEVSEQSDAKEQNAREYILPSLNSCSVFLVISGELHWDNADSERTNIGRGFIGFLAARTAMRLEIVKQPLVAYRAYCDDANANLV